MDTIDGEIVSAVIESRGWQLIRQRIERTLQLKLNELEQPLDAVKTADVRGCIAGLRLALRIPDILVAESKKEAGDEASNKA